MSTEKKDTGKKAENMAATVVVIAPERLAEYVGINKNLDSKPLWKEGTQRTEGPDINIFFDNQAQLPLIFPLNADITGINISNMDMPFASLIGANLTKARVRFTNFCGANMARAKLDQADIATAVFIGARGMVIPQSAFVMPGYGNPIYTPRDLLAALNGKHSSRENMRLYYIMKYVVENEDKLKASSAAERTITIHGKDGSVKQVDSMDGIGELVKWYNNLELHLHYPVFKDIPARYLSQVMSMACNQKELEAYKAQVYDKQTKSVAYQPKEAELFSTLDKLLIPDLIKMVASYSNVGSEVIDLSDQLSKILSEILEEEYNATPHWLRDGPISQSTQPKRNELKSDKLSNLLTRMLREISPEERLAIEERLAMKKKLVAKEEKSAAQKNAQVNAAASAAVNASLRPADSDSKGGGFETNQLRYLDKASVFGSFPGTIVAPAGHSYHDEECTPASSGLGNFSGDGEEDADIGLPPSAASLGANANASASAAPAARPLAASSAADTDSKSGSSGLPAWGYRVGAQATAAAWNDNSTAKPSIGSGALDLGNKKAAPSALPVVPSADYNASVFATLATYAISTDSKDGVNAVSGTLPKTTPSFACLSTIDFEGADWSGHDFSNKFLTDANFQNANLTGANFEGATLINAKLAGANFEKANLRGVNFEDADFIGVGSVQDTIGTRLAKIQSYGTKFSEAGGARFSDGAVAYVYPQAVKTAIKFALKFSVDILRGRHKYSQAYSQAYSQTDEYVTTYLIPRCQTPEALLYQLKISLRDPESHFETLYLAIKYIAEHSAWLVALERRYVKITCQQVVGIECVINVFKNLPINTSYPKLMDISTAGWIQSIDDVAIPGKAAKNLPNAKKAFAVALASAMSAYNIEGMVRPLQNIITDYQSDRDDEAVAELSALLDAFEAAETNRSGDSKDAISKLEASNIAQRIESRKALFLKKMFSPENFAFDMPQVMQVDANANAAPAAASAAPDAVLSSGDADSKEPGSAWARGLDVSRAAPPASSAAGQPSPGAVARTLASRASGEQSIS